MSIETRPFGGVTLSGEDAEKFIRQVKYGRPKKAAIEALRLGVALLKQYETKGYIVLARKS